MEPKQQISLIENLKITNKKNKDIMATLGFVPFRLGSNYAEVSFNRDDMVFVFGTDSRSNSDGKNVFLLCEDDRYKWRSYNCNVILTYVD